MDVVHARALEESAEGELRRLRSKRDVAQRAAAQAAAMNLQVQEQKSLPSSAAARRELVELAEKPASDRAAAEAARAAQEAASAASASAPSTAAAVAVTTASVPVVAGPGAPAAVPEDALMQRLALFNKVKEASPDLSDESIVYWWMGTCGSCFRSRLLSRLRLLCRFRPRLFQWLRRRSVCSAPAVAAAGTSALRWFICAARPSKPIRAGD